MISKEEKAADHWEFGDYADLGFELLISMFNTVFDMVFYGIVLMPVWLPCYLVGRIGRLFGIKKKAKSK